MVVTLLWRSPSPPSDYKRTSMSYKQWIHVTPPPSLPPSLILYPSIETERHHTQPLTNHPHLPPPTTLSHPPLLTLHSSPSTPHPPLLTLHSSPSTPHPPLLTLHFSPSTPHPPLLTLHFSPSTPHPPLLTLHSSPSLLTLHSSPSTPHLRDMGIRPVSSISPLLPIRSTFHILGYPWGSVSTTWKMVPFSKHSSLRTEFFRCETFALCVKGEVCVCVCVCV